jgi:hypothetical protein
VRCYAEVARTSWPLKFIAASRSPPRVRKMVAALTAGTGTRDQLNKWEYREADGTIVNLLQNDDAPPFKTPARDAILEDEEP